MSPTVGRVLEVCCSGAHEFSKQPSESIRLIQGLGVEGDAHSGVTIQHRSRLARHRDQPNLRQVHLVEAELFDHLELAGHAVGPGELGENITTTGVDLLSLPADTRLEIGDDAQIRLTGLRNPCKQIDTFQPGLRARVVTRDAGGNPVFGSGVMSVVTRSGVVQPGDAIVVVGPPRPYVDLARV